MNFRHWLEGGQGSGTKMSATGYGAGGQAQAGIGMTKPAKPQVVPASPHSPRDDVSAGWKPAAGPGGMHGTYKAPVSGIMGCKQLP